MQQISVSTHSRTEMLNIMAAVQDTVADTDVTSGLCTVFVPHTTAGITINENADPAVPYDLLKELNSVIPFDDNYTHDEGNSAAHIKASMMGSSVQAPVEDGRLQLGVWQGIFFCEFDGPRQRRVWIQVT